MSAEQELRLTDIFVSVPDPRSTRQTQHNLAELLTVSVCAMLCGADDFIDIELWAQTKLVWLRRFLKLEAGVPSHDTFARVFGLLDPQAFEAAFLRWVGAVVPVLAPGSVVAVDGKTSRGTKSQELGPLHMVSAFAAGMGLVLGQRATEHKSNEISAIPQLLATLALEGTIVTLDAMGTQTEIARSIRSRGADYVLCVKDNHPKLVDSILLTLAGVAEPLTQASYFEMSDKPGAHGRSEIRRCWAYDDISHLYKAQQWEGLRSFAVIERVRTVKGQTSTERQFYISSLAADAQQLAGAVRSHWEIENRLHGCLDVQLKEDQSRARHGHVAHNLAVVRHIVLNLLRLNASRKASIKSKRLLACSDDHFRAEILGL